MNLDLTLTPDWLGWRGALLALVVLLLFYVIVVFLRLRRLKRRKADAASEEAHADEPGVASAGLAASAVAAYASVQEPALRAPPEPLAAPSEAAFPWNAPSTESALRRRLIGVENELEQLRKEVGGLRAEVLVLREEVLHSAETLAQLQRPGARPEDAYADPAGRAPVDDEIDESDSGDSGEAADAAALVSPLYNEAMQYALAGHDAANISQQCGISRAEAELVVALVRNRDAG